MNPIVQTSLVGIVSALLAYIGTRRINSGTIGTSDAATLWNVMNQELERLRKRDIQQQSEIDSLYARLRKCEDKYKP